MNVQSVYIQLMSASEASDISNKISEALNFMISILNIETSADDNIIADKLFRRIAVGLVELLEAGFYNDKFFTSFEIIHQRLLTISARAEIFGVKLFPLYNRFIGR